MAIINGNEILFSANLINNVDKMRDINSITLNSSTAGAKTLKITKDNDNENFSLYKVRIAGRLIYDNTTYSGNLALRIRTDNGNRYFCLKASATSTGLINFVTDAEIVNVFTEASTKYYATENTQGTGAANTVDTIATGAIGATAITDVEAFLMSGSTVVPLLEGSFLYLRGVDI